MIVALTVLQVGEMSCLAFAGGDWCWGPRYLIPVMPLWAIAFPPFFIPVKMAKMSVIGGLAAWGIIVCVLWVIDRYEPIFLGPALDELLGRQLGLFSSFATGYSAG